MKKGFRLDDILNLLYCSHRGECTQEIEYENEWIAWKQRQYSRDVAIHTTILYITPTTTRKIIFGWYQIFHAFGLLPLIFTTKRVIEWNYNCCRYWYSVHSFHFIGARVQLCQRIVVRCDKILRSKSDKLCLCACIFRSVCNELYWNRFRLTDDAEDGVRNKPIYPFRFSVIVRFPLSFIRLHKINCPIEFISDTQLTRNFSSIYRTNHRDLRITRHLHK